MNATQKQRFPEEEEAEMFWDPAEDRMIFELPAGVGIKKRYYNRPFSYQDTCEVWALTNGQFVVEYSPTGCKFLFDTWDEAKQFRSDRVRHYRAIGKLMRW